MPTAGLDRYGVTVHFSLPQLVPKQQNDKNEPFACKRFYRLFVICTLATLLTSCAPSLPLLLIGGATYIAQNQWAKHKKEGDEQTAPHRQALNSPASRTVALPEKTLPDHCHRIEGATVCRLE